ncbi:helix-turn-helix domain-containing protein [Pseudonocardia acaciae]|uniref:helix-turn-helix domain-containing protein n=1 Tax=Pseudonocardia acaciae TaxID=551276 RepID=UPI00056614DF|nr:XRE family transcriptional regulator [Pseudonocardia acaciae]
MARALRRERERLGWSLTELARRAGVAKSTLSQLEAGNGNPNVETLWSLAVALGVPFSRVVDPQPQPVRVIRAGTGPAIPSEQARFTGTVLSTCPPGARRDLHVITLEPGATRLAEPHIPGTVEHLVVTSGRVRCGPRDEEVELAVGDYARFAGDVPHSYLALEPHSAGVLIMEYS